jgi:hypothetical protein
MNFYVMSFDEIKRYYYNNGISHDAIGRLIELYEDLDDDRKQLDCDIETIKDALFDFNQATKGIL